MLYYMLAAVIVLLTVSHSIYGRRLAHIISKIATDNWSISDARAANGQDTAGRPYQLRALNHPVGTPELWAETGTKEGQLPPAAHCRPDSARDLQLGCGTVTDFLHLGSVKFMLYLENAADTEVTRSLLAGLMIPFATLTLLKGFVFFMYHVALKSTSVRRWMVLD